LKSAGGKGASEVWRTDFAKGESEQVLPGYEVEVSTEGSDSSPSERMVTCPRSRKKG
jgi:hypothetical protein